MVGAVVVLVLEVVVIAAQRHTHQIVAAHYRVARTSVGPKPTKKGCANKRWAEAHEQIARMTLTIKLDRNWSSFQLANSAPPLSVTDSAIAPSARMQHRVFAVL